MMDAPYFLVPAPDGSDRAHLATLVAGAVHRLAPLGFAFGRVAAVSPDYVAGLLPVRATRARVYRAQLGPGGTVTRRRTVGLPPHLTVHAFALHGPFLYVGGAWSPRAEGTGLGAAAGRLDLRVTAPQWEPVDLPVPAAVGKALDDVLADAQGLVLVDNIVFPKYLFAYRWSVGEGLPMDPQAVELPFWRVYEHIQKGQLSAEYVALLSTSAGMDGVGTYVSVLRRSDWTPVVVFTYEQSREEQWAEALLMHPWDAPVRSACPFDVALQEHTLVLACPGALLFIDLWAFPTLTQPPCRVRGDEAEFEPTYPLVDLRGDAPVPGVGWEILAPHERPDSIRFIAPRQLLLTTMGNAELNAERAWVRNVNL